MTPADYARYRAAIGEPLSRSGEERWNMYRYLDTPDGTPGPWAVTDDLDYRHDKAEHHIVSDASLAAWRKAERDEAIESRNAETQAWRNCNARAEAAEQARAKAHNKLRRALRYLDSDEPKLAAKVICAALQTPEQEEKP